LCPQHIENNRRRKNAQALVVRVDLFFLIWTILHLNEVLRVNANTEVNSFSLLTVLLDAATAMLDIIIRIESITDMYTEVVIIQQQQQGNEKNNVVHDDSSSSSSNNPQHFGCVDAVRLLDVEDDPHHMVLVHRPASHRCMSLLPLDRALRCQIICPICALLVVFTTTLFP
jgi:hypothetical protein